MIWYIVLILLTGVERIWELVLSTRNARWAFERGGREFGRRHYPFMVVLHTGLLLACLAEVYFGDRPFLPWLGWPMLAVALACQGLRYWCIAVLGRQWNSRVIVVPGLGRVDARSVPLAAASELLVVDRRGHRAAARAHRVDHRARVHRAERDPAVRLPHPHRGARARGTGPRAGRGRMSQTSTCSSSAEARSGSRRRSRRGCAGCRRRSSSPASRPIDKACGEGLMPGAVTALARLGVTPAGYPLLGIGYRSADRQVDHRFGGGSGGAAAATLAVAPMRPMGPATALAWDRG